MSTWTALKLYFTVLAYFISWPEGKDTNKSYLSMTCCLSGKVACVGLMVFWTNTYFKTTDFLWSKLMLQTCCSLYVNSNVMQVWMRQNHCVQTRHQSIWASPFFMYDITAQVCGVSRVKGNIVSLASGYFKKKVCSMLWSPQNEVSHINHLFGLIPLIVRGKCV